MRSHLGARNLISLQQLAAIKEIDERIRKDWQDGYGNDVDVLLERRHSLTEQMKEGPVA